MPKGKTTQPSRVEHGPINRASQVWLEDAIKTRMPDRDPSAIALFVYIQGVGRHAEAMLSNLLRDRGLDGSQLTMLSTLWFSSAQRLSPTALHRLLVQSPSGISHTSRRLEAGGLIRRVTDDADGRARYIQLTAKGRRMAAACMEDLARALDPILEGKSDAQVGKLADLQRQIAELLSGSPLSYPITSRPLGLSNSDES